MPDPINGRVMLPRSLEVNRIEQIRAASAQNHQQDVSQDQKKLLEKHQQQVNKSNESEGQRIRSDEEKSGRKKQDAEQRKKQKNEEKDSIEEKMHFDEDRGHIIDYRV